MKINWQLVSRTLGLGLIGLLVWLAKVAVVQLLDIRKELTSIDVQLAEVRASMLTKEDVRLIVRAELFERGIK